MAPFIWLISTLIDVYSFMLLVYIIMSLLIAFDIINAYQPLVSRIQYALSRLIEPALKPIRKYMPDLGGIDLSPIILIIFLNFIDYSIHYYFVRAVY